MTKRRERPLEELYNLTDQISGPEITPVLKGSFRIQGPVDELDRDNWRYMEMSPAKKKIRSALDDNLCSRAESGTCNVCAAPCTSCMHFNQTVSFMESTIEDELSGETCKSKEVNYNSSGDADVLPLFKSKACEERQCTASETSNLLSASSCHDSFSENAESKATIKTSDTAEVFEDVEMLSKLLSGGTIKNDKLLAGQCRGDGHGVINSHNSISSHTEKSSMQYEEQQGLESHDDNISCITGVKDPNALVGDNHADSERKHASCSSASASNFLAEGFGKAVQVQKSPGFLTECQYEIGQSPREPSTSTKHSLQSRTSGIKSGTADSFHKSGPSEPPSASDIYVRNSIPISQSPCSDSQIGNSFVGLGDSKVSEENSYSQLQEGPFTECFVEHVDSSLEGPVTRNGGDGRKSAAFDSSNTLPNSEECNASLTKKNSPPVSLMKVHPCVENDMVLDSDKPQEMCMGSSLEGASTVNGHKFGALDSGSALPNAEDSKATVIENNSSSMALVEVHPFLKNDVGSDSDKLPEISVVSSDLNQKYISSASLKVCSAENNPLESRIISEIDHSASDVMEVDVKVCDICGDTGREDLLATCSRCIDGAEHIYCMQVMLDKVPEGDWLCEECHLKEDADKQNPDKTKAFSEIPRALLLDKNQPLQNLKSKPQEADGNLAMKAVITPKVPTKRYVDKLEVALDSSKEAVETRVGSPGTASSCKKAALSRESSFKKLNLDKVKSVHLVSSSGGHPPDDSPESVHSLTRSSPNALWMQARNQSSRGCLSRSSSFNNSKPKVKQISEDVPQKRKLTRELSNTGTRKERSFQKFGKSLSFKSAVTGLSKTNASKSKLMSPISSRSEQSRCLKQGIDQSSIERKKSFKSDDPMVNFSQTIGAATSVKKVAERDGRLSTSFQSPVPVSKGSGNVIASDGSGGIRKQCNSEKQGLQVDTKKGRMASYSWADDEARGSPESCRQNGLPQIKEFSDRDGKIKDPLSLSCYKQNITSGGKNIQCHRSKEIGHLSQFCTASSAHKASDSRSASKVKVSNKWKDVVTAALSSSPAHKSKKFAANLNELSLPSLSNSLSNLAMPDGGSMLEWQQMHSDLKFVPLVSDNDTKIIKPYAMNTPIHCSTLGNPPRLSAIPEHDYIWQGDFDVWSGSFLESFVGIQAHLSTCASPKVLEVVNKFPDKVQLEEVSRISAWPMQFQGNCVTEDYIAIYFFAKDLESYERNYKKLLENMLQNDLALKGNFAGIELLIFPSNCLPEKSQRWNRLFYLWAVFRERRMNYSVSPCDSQKKLCGATVNVDPSVQDRTNPVKAEVSTSQKISMQGDLGKGSTTCYSVHIELDADKSNKVGSSSISSSAREDGDFYTKTSSVDESSRRSHDGILSAKKHTSYSFPEIYTSASVRQMTDLAGTCSSSRTMSSDAKLCSEMNSSSASQKEVYRDNGNGNVRELQPCTQATNGQSGLVKVVPIHLTTSNCRQAGLTSSSPDRQDPSSDSSKIFPTSPFLVREASVTGNKGDGIDLDGQRLVDARTSQERDMQVEPITEEQNSWEVRSSRKRPAASVETPTKTTYTVAWRENSGCLMVDEENKENEYKLCSEGLSEREIPGNRFSSAMCGLYPSFQNEEHKDAYVYENGLETSERHFFPVDPAQALKSGRQILPLKDRKLQESDSPNLELALGAKQEVPLFSRLEDDRNEHLDQEIGAGDDASASVSLSLSLSLTAREQTAKSVTMTESLLPKRHHVNTSLLLFGSLIDT